MIKLTKRTRIMQHAIENNKKYDVIQAINILKNLTTHNFVESMDVDVNLGIDVRKSDQNIIGNVILPHGIGRNIRVAVFAPQDEADAVKDVGADLVGMDDLVKHIQKKLFDYDVVIASPDSMHLVQQLSQILGPRGLMPNIKLGTITKNIIEAVKYAKAGQIYYRNDKNGIIHSTIGKINFDTNQLKENLESFLMNLKKNKPVQCKSVFIKKVSMSTTMSIGIHIDQNSLSINI